MGTSILYFWGCLASSMMGMMLGRFFAMFTRSRPADAKQVMSVWAAQPFLGSIYTRKCMNEGKLECRKAALRSSSTAKRVQFEGGLTAAVRELHGIHSALGTDNV